MARHRNIRGQNYDEDYEGYDDVYGHSVEDDFMYGASPSTAEQFLYRRGHHELSSYLEDIGEDDRNSDSEQPLADSRNYERPKLSDVDEARLQSCLDEIRNVVGDTTPEHVLIDAVVANKFDYERALDAILNKQETNHKTKIDTRTDPTLVTKSNPNSQDAYAQSSLGRDGRDSDVHKSKVKGPHVMNSYGGQGNASSFSNVPVANQSVPSKFQSYYDKVAADNDLGRFDMGSSSTLPESKESTGRGFETRVSLGDSSGHHQGTMQFYLKDVAYSPQSQMQGQMKSQLPDKAGLSMQAGGVSLGELSRMQETGTNAALGKPSGRVHPPGLGPAPSTGVGPAPSMGLSDLASSHLTDMGTGKPLKPVRGRVVGKKSGAPSLADLACGQSSIKVKEKSSVPSNVSLSALASSQLCSSIVPCQKPLSSTKNTMQANLSLADLASGLRPTSSTIPQTNKQGHTSGLRSSLSGNVSLSDLASSHLSSSPKQSLLTNKQSGMKAPGIKSIPSSGLSLSDLASSHLSSSPKQSLLTNKQSGMEAPGIKSIPSSGLSLSDLASSHLSSSPTQSLLTNKQSGMEAPGIKSIPSSAVSLADLASSHFSSSPGTSAMGSLSEIVGGTGGTTTTLSGVSCADLANTNQPSSPKHPLGSQIGKKNEKESDNKSSAFSLLNPQSEQTSIPTASKTMFGTKEAKADQKGMLELGTLSSRHVTDKKGSMEASEGLQRPRVTPGFDFFIRPPSHSTSLQLDEKRQPQPHVSGIHSRNNRQSNSSRISNKMQPAKNTSSKSTMHSKPILNSSGISATVSTFGNALCHQCQTASAKAKMIAQGRIGYHGVQRRVLHRQFSFERQKSRKEESKEESWREVQPFDFSTPSLDDIVKKRQQGAFIPLNQRPQRTDNTAELDSRLRLDQTVDDSATQITRLRFEGKDPKQGFQVNVEDTSKGKSPGGEGGAGGGEDETKVEGAGSRKGALSPTRLSETSSSRRSSRESLPNVSSESDLQAYSSATSTPSRKEGRKALSVDIAKELEKRQAGKELLNLVVIGHVDAGKSTLMGHLLYLLGQVNQRVMHKYETESRKQGKASFAYAWVLDETEEERGRGITMDVGLTRFETTHRLVTLLDAPGHKDFIPNMITGAAQADAAILVVDATRGEFETGFESGGQTREHALLVRSLGVRQLVVGVNKLDTVSWSEERFSEIVKKLGAFLKQAGFKESDVVYIPCSGLTGENLTEQAKEPALTSWYSETCLLDHIDKLKPPKRSTDQSMRLCVSDVFKGMGSGVSVSGKIETGSLQIGEKIMVMPAGENGLIKVITVHDEDTRWACAGDHTTIVITGVDQMNLTIGSVICTYHDPIRASTRFQARVVIFNIEVPLTKGFPVLVHYQSVSEPAVIKKLVSVLHKSTGEVVQKKPKCLTKQMNAIIELETSRPVCLELYKDYKELGRFMLRYGGSTIAAGVVTELKY
ncbi:uncharacterized protein LOC591684 isoform X1 [Strongylocentrotus purpuratus]|uniref:Tr-type G domain-containing protein n=1 Tax=Strongylocentrotus purpuratus TaxID=7668 RepID=A0A7M7NN95_STRPU|nr:uncharacterized protein LOC591684 isoform X1 [Strongylocentrotus purpuratus]